MSTKVIRLLIRRVGRLVDERNALRGAVVRVVALHRPSTDHGPDHDPYCVGCYEAGGYDGAPSWPCPTFQAVTDG